MTANLLDTPLIQEASLLFQPFHDKIVTTSTNKGELLAFEFSSLGPCSFPLVFEHLLCRNLLLETSHLERSECQSSVSTEAVSACHRKSDDCNTFGVTLT